MRDHEQIPASFEQERAYVVDRLTRGTTVAVHRAWTLSAAPTVERLRAALDRLTARHEILRTSVSHSAGGLVQVVHAAAEPDFTVVDQSLSDAADNQPPTQLAMSFVARPFRLDTAPLWRTLLVRTGADQHVLVVCAHPTVADAETLTLILGELLDLCQGPPGEGAAAELPGQYREYVAWQGSLDDASLARQEAYWLDVLRGEPQAAELPIFRSRPPVPAGRGALHRRPLPADVVARAERLAERTGCSLPTVLAAGFAALLYRYGATTEVTFGYVLRGRRRDFASALLGPVGNLAPIRLAVTTQSSFEDVLRLTAGRLALAEANQDHPFQRLGRGRSGGSATAPMFQLLFESELDLTPAHEFSRPGDLDVDDFDVPPAYVGYDVHLTVRRLASGPALDWVFDTELFGSELIDQVLAHFVQLLSAALTDPAAPVAELAFLSAADRAAITSNWNVARTPYRRCAVHRLIEEQVTRTPAATAVEFAGQRLSYTELNRRANQLARHLTALGAEEGEMVGLCMDRSADLVVAVVAIMKAGCVVVPLDAAYPQDRLRFLLEDARVRTVVTTEALLARIPAMVERFGDRAQVRTDQDRAAIAEHAATNLEDAPAADAAAYCIYTSGSTGRPKGAVVEHGALANLVAWHADTWLTGVGTRTLLYSPISFDVSFHEILAGLCTGATLVQVDEGTRANPMALLEFVRRERVEKWYMPFVTLQQIAQAAQTGGVPTVLKELIVGGEVLRITAEIRDFARRTGCVIRNHYGSTECIDVATHTLSGDPDGWPSVVPIGRANVHNMNLYILDGARQLLPVGVVGEIYAEGDLLARHYHGRPDLTRERFLPSPFGVQGDRLYRMGDLGRYLPDGTIECLGRADNQVKIRGFRVEPSEVEAVLAGHPAVAECVVAAKVFSQGSARLTAYVVPERGHDPSGLPDRLRAGLADQLPDYMVPTAVVVLDALPLTPSGKVDVRGLPDPRTETRSAAPEAARLERTISQIWAELLELPTVDLQRTFFELGGDSVLLVRAHQRLAEEFGRPLPVDALFRYPTVAALAGFLDTASAGRETTAESPPVAPSHATDRDLAIIGMACRVPGADTVEQFWTNLRDGVESVTTLSPGEVFALQPDQTRDPRFVPAAAMIPDVDLFDADFFGYSPAEAAVIDPQQRLFLEYAWAAVEDAGIDPAASRAGVFAGASMNTYLINNVLPATLGSRTFLSHRHFDQATELRIEQGNARDHLPTRVSFKLNLRGPSVNVQSTCSTSLVAVHMAGQALLNGECDVAIAGGVSVIIPQNTGYLWQDGMMLAPDGHCRAFDADAGGTVFGNGLGVVVLKRLSAALADGDHVYAVIKGSAVNNDGALKMDYSGPSVESQADVVARAHASAGIRADEISYVEAHGTGTKLGDPVEIAGLTEAFARSASRGDTYCAIGSVKTNIGHLDEAAGVIGLIKTALSLYHRELPPSLHFRSPNPLARLEQSPFFVNTRLREWTSPPGRPRRAGVSSFGMGGTNCHVVLEEPPAPSPAPSHPGRSAHVLPLSARSTEALRGNVQRYLQHLNGQDDAAFPDICFSAATGRRHFDTRIAVLASDATDARAQLAAVLAAPDLATLASHVGGRRPTVAFLFTGQGSQYAGMGRSLYQSQPVFRAAIDRCDEVLRPLTGWSLVEVLYGSDPDGSIDSTATAQPALFALGYALHELWVSWGVRPDLLVGHSLGEYVAACVAGVFSLEDGLRLVAARGRLMQELPGVGGMVQVDADRATVAPYLTGHEEAVTVASVNSPESTVISGRLDVLAVIRRELTAAGVGTVSLNVSHAFHSPLMRPMLDAFRTVAESVRYSAPTVDIVSNVTGEPVGPGELESAGYWVRHVVDPVRFDRAMQVADQRGVGVFVELGAKPTLSNLARRQVTGPDVHWLPSLTPRDPDAALASIRQLYLAGVPVDWSGFDAPFRRRRVPVPTYAFQRRRHWIKPRPAQPPDGSGPVSVGSAPVALAPVAVAAPPAGVDVGDTVSRLDVVWEPVAVGTASPAARRYFVVGDESDLANALAGQLRAHGHRCVEVVGADMSGTVSALDGDRRLSRAFAELAAGAAELHVVFVPALSPDIAVPEAQARLLTRARNLLELAAGSTATRSLWFVTGRSRPDGPTTEAELGHSGLAALARTVNAEHPELVCVALTVPALSAGNDLELAAALLQRDGLDGEEELAVHGGQVHAARLTATSANPAQVRSVLPIRADGTYLITGGTSGIGLRLAVAVARHGPGRLVLLSRRGEPAPGEEATWAALRATGIQVEMVRADVGDGPRMREVLAGCGPDLRGVFHCAGVLDDAILLRQDPEQAARVLRPKVNGAWLLHEHTRDRELDFFVLFSSLASVLGYQGQGSYAFANAFLDSLARYRRQHGLPALSVSWASWAGAGMTARLAEAHRARLRDKGESPLLPGAAIAALASLMADDATHAAVASMDWDRFAASAPRTPSMVRALVRATVPTAPTGATFAARLRQVPPDASRETLRNTVTAAVRAILGGDTGEIDPTRGFTDLGVDSLGALDLTSRLKTDLGVALPATLAFEHPCLDDLVTHLESRYFAEEIRAESVTPAVAGRTAAEPEPHAEVARPAGAVALIGMSCRFPGAASPDEFWDLLVQGRDAVREIPAERWDVDQVYDASPETPGTMYVRRAAFIDDPAAFDPAFFGISPREAASMDPRHRLLLEAAWSAVEAAGIDPGSLRGSDTAVYLGCDEFTNDYLQHAASHLDSDPYVATGTTLSFTAGRLSYKLGLHGPSMVIATACSSSLVAMHSAVRAIRQGECGMAIVAGAKLMLGPQETIQLCRLQALAPDGRSKAFAADADGFGRGEGCAAVILKSLDRAVADGDPVLAVVRGTAVNHDGPSSGLTVPSGPAQTRLVNRALADGGLDPADVTYLEAHGTGTPLGDPIELRALGEVFAQRRQPLLVGSVKANIGHLEEAAGLAGVIKVVLALRHGVIPPQIHCATPTDKVDWASLPVTVPRTAMDWPTGAPRIAGVSSFGMSGTNAHVLLEAFPSSAGRPAVPSGPLVFPFSARDRADLVATVRAFVDVLAAPHDAAEVAYTLQVGRKAHRCRLVVVAADTAALRARLEGFLRGTPSDADTVSGEAGRTNGTQPADTVRRLIADGDLHGLARLWCDGHRVDWHRLYVGDVPRRIALPTYPFKRERIWIGEERTPLVPSQRTVDQTPDRADLAREVAADPPDGLFDTLRAHVADLLGMAPTALPATAFFDNLGVDSLVYMRVSHLVRDRFGVVISFQQLTEEANSLQELVDLVSSQLTRRPAAPASAQPGPREIDPARAAAPTPATPADAASGVPASRPEPQFGSRPSAPQRGQQPTEQLTDRQARFVAEFVAAYATRTSGSKAAAEQDRPVLANCRMPPFQALLKEVSYPIVVERSAGARFWDVDGNEYVDISMGYGVHLFGHSPSFVLDALRDQLDKGLHIGPQAVSAGSVAGLLCELTGMSRAAFCNSGTEAVMAALRFARAATGRTRFVMFEGSYHGWSDNTLALPAGTRSAVPMARGIGAGAMDDVVVLEYGTEESLEMIRELGPELAAVLVEPVQSRRPDLQPVNFLRELREVTRASGTALVFDEVITGFRVHPGGAQVWSGVDADIVTYGKILGGGLPIGAITGRAEFMDTVDGGSWQYGDDSAPTVPTTFFGGTFNKNPLSMAAAHSVLTRVKAEGPELQHRLADSVAWLADDFNAFCRQQGFPLRIVHFSSLFRFIGEGEYSLQRFPIAIDLFFRLLALKGVYVLETRVCFLSTSHTPDDVRFVSETAKECLIALRNASFFAEATAAGLADAQPGRRLADDARLGPTFTVPYSGHQAESADVLLTGATGFLGAYLARDLLRNTSARVHCLVRARDAEHARQRVLDNLAANGCLESGATERVVGVPADLARPRLGIDDRTWRRLAEEIGAIYHNGAQVNSLLPYDRLRAANVAGTRELLRLATHVHAKSFHHVSSDAVFDAYGYHRYATIYEDEPLAHAASLYGGGYAETKWVADKLVEHARAAGLHASIYRPGPIMGALSGGCGQLGDFITRFIKGVIQLGACPELEATVDFVPVDVVSELIVTLSRDDVPRTYHLTHPNPITYREFVDAIRDAGYRLDVLPLHVWDAELAKLRYEDDNALYPLLPLFTESSDPVFRRSRLDTRNVSAHLLRHPPLLELVPAYLQRFAAAGFLPPPSGQVAGRRTEARRSW
ncbi:amino acid adenylation domain-containing protein/thioester reductase-like protein [Micromonospora pisi]|uniref:Amino acid adenylation domain-containing protein/thioester reductase-like protein n=1 Tax=Micromonospora pisi TaxID=589240 RepID=A0A495JRS6_9ACTN|nr:non-ribosomal peptide synthetase/type I polyketide synthase [Micromonospora pisi]RKR91092.1 amino acid adenylation domain-containing protein/thioester reductase-like protein [Micromonospora pisi]